ncbi:MAG TPA: DUF3267 domain-containing protein [Longimicrobiaceae bacterium]|nr:DUF3267 domain-containing protein [Longimicrobiaceae bacterium]
MESQPVTAPDAALSDATVSFEKANLIALLFLPLAALPVLLHLLLWGAASLAAGVDFLFPWLFVPLLVASIVVHEALHALGFVAVGGAPRGAIHFGVDRRTLSPFAGCTAPLRARAYRGAVLLPSLVLGVAPVVAGLVTGSGWPTLWGALMLFCAGGDFAALWAMRAVPGDARVLDHPERVGCRVVG